MFFVFFIVSFHRHHHLVTSLIGVGRAHTDCFVWKKSHMSTHRPESPAWQRKLIITLLIPVISDWQIANIREGWLCWTSFVVQPSDLSAQDEKPRNLTASDNLQQGWKSFLMSDKITPIRMSFIKVKEYAFQVSILCSLYSLSAKLIL